MAGRRVSVTVFATCIAILLGGCSQSIRVQVENPSSVNLNVYEVFDSTLVKSRFLGTIPAKNTADYHIGKKGSGSDYHLQFKKADGALVYDATEPSSKINAGLVNGTWNIKIKP